MEFQNLINISIKVFLCVIPVFLFKKYIPSFAQGIFFLMASFFIYGLSIGTQPLRRYKNDWIKFIYLWLFLSIFFKGTANPSQEWFNFWVSSIGFSYVLAGILLFLTTYSYVINIEKIIYPIIGVCIFNAIFSIYQIFGINLLWAHPVGITGLFSSINQLSQYSAMALPLAYFINPFLAVIPLFNLIISGSFIQQTPSGYIAVMVGFIFLLWKKQIKKLHAVIFISVFIVMFIFTYQHTMSQLKPWFTVSRPNSWNTAINYILKKPWIGYGYQSYTEVVKGNTQTIGYYSEDANPGSDWLHNAFEFGLPFIAFLILFFAGYWEKFSVNKKNDRITYFLMASIIIALSNMCWQNMIRFASIGGTFIVILALLTIKLEEI